MAAIGWRLGTAGGPQRVRVEMLGSAGQVVQRLSFNASAVVARGASGCATTIGVGGQFERLDSELLKELLAQGRGTACICFLPGSHRLDGLSADGGGQARLSLHGCGHASQLSSSGQVELSGFAALEVRDLVIALDSDSGVALLKNGELRLAEVQLDRRRAVVAMPTLRVAGAERMVMTGCVLTSSMPTLAAVFQELGGDCRIVQNRFGGIVSFYGDAAGVPSAAVVRRLLAMRQNLRFDRADAHLTFSDNTVSMLALGSEMTQRILEGNAEGLFASAVLHGNTFLEFSNVFAANLLAFHANSFVGVPVDGSTPYGVMVANTASATGNVAVRFGDEAILHFVAPEEGMFARAANRIFIQPFKSVADT